jgi:sulfur relay (sulfurtransferase) DsrF/TusC family protein
MKALQIIQSAYRCTVEEQDDPVVWFAQVLQNNGGEIDLLLRGNAVNYVISGQDSSGLSFGKWQQNQPAKLDLDLADCLKNGLNIYIITEDAQIRGVSPSKMIEGVKEISRQDLPKLFEKYEQVWHW